MAELTRCFDNTPGQIGADGHEIPLLLEGNKHDLHPSRELSGHEEATGKASRRVRPAQWGHYSPKWPELEEDCLATDVRSQECLLVQLAQTPRVCLDMLLPEGDYTIRSTRAKRESACLTTGTPGTQAENRVEAIPQTPIVRNLADQWPPLGSH